MSRPRTLGELRTAVSGDRVSVKEEMRRNLLRKLEGKEPLFPGVLGYEDSVIPQIANAVLSKHNMILLGLRGQAKSRLMRSLTGLLDPEIPAVAGCEIGDDPFRPLCRSCRDRIAKDGDATAIVWLKPDDRYVEKLATPDVTIADIIGDVDPIRAARGGFDLASELTMHYGLLPRAHRGIFALNELPDLAGRIQVGLFNILQEGNVQIKGYPVRLPVDVCIVFTANPRTTRPGARSSLPSRTGSGARFAPTTRRRSSTAWRSRPRRPGPSGRPNLVLPRYVREVVEGIAFAARRNKKIDRHSGVSQRLPISALENAVSNAERRALRTGESPIVPRISGHLRGAPLADRQIRARVRRRADGRGEPGPRADPRSGGRGLLRSHGGGGSSARWFRSSRGAARSASGRTRRLRRSSGSSSRFPEVLAHVQLLGAKPEDPAPLRAAAGEFVLEGLWAQRKIGRSDDRGFVAVEATAQRRRAGPGAPRAVAQAQEAGELRQAWVSPATIATSASSGTI